MQALRTDARFARVLRSLVVTLLAISLLGLPSFAPGAAALTEEVEGLIGDPGGSEDGLVELASWIGSLESEGRFGQALPLLEPSVGEALNLGGTFAGVRTSFAGLTSTDVTDLASDIAALDGTFGAPSVNVTFDTTGVDATGPVVGFDLTMTATRSIPTAALDITAPATTPDVKLKSVGAAGVPLEVTMTSLFTVRYDVDTNQFYVVENDQGTPSEADDTPRFTAEAGVPNNTPSSSFTFPASGFTAAIGFGDVTIEPTSSMSLHATFFGDINDSNLDQELAFREPGNPGELIDAELRLPRSQNVAISRAGTVAASIDLDSPFTAANDDAVLQIPAPGNLDGADPVPTASGADLAELAQFGNVKPVDVVAGLVQYATLLRALQGNPNVDFDLPFLNGKLSDVVHVEEQLARFADDQVADGITPDTPISEMVEFDTALQLADHMQTGAESIADLQDTNGAATGKLTPTYDPATDRLTFDIHVLKTLDGSFGPFPELPADFEPPPGFESDAGLPNVGDQLKEQTGLRAVTGTGGSQAQRKTAYEFRLPFIVDLVNSVPATDIAETEGITEFENPMVHERFLTSTANSDDMKITGVVQTPVTAEGQIGFVGITIGGAGPLASTYTLDQTALATPMLTVNVDATRATYDHDHDGDDGPDAGDTAEIPFTATPRIVDLLLNLVDDPDAAGEPTPETDNDPVIPSQPSAKVDSVLKEQVMGPGALAGDNYSLTELPGEITIAWPNISTPIAPADVQLDATAEMLKKLDIVPNGDPTALLGKTLDKITNIADSIDAGLQSVGGVLGTDIPLLGSSAKELFTGAQTLIDEVEEFRTSPSPVTLQDLETSFQNALGSELGLGAAARAQLLRFSLKDAIVGGEPELVLRLGFIDGGTKQVPLNLDIGFGDIVGANSGGTATLTTAADVKLNIPITLEAPSASDLTDADPQILNSSGFKISAEVADQTGASKFGVNLGPLTLDLGQTPNGPQRYQFGAEFSALPGGTEVPESSETAQSLSAFFSSLTPAVTGAANSPYDCQPPDDGADGGTEAPEVLDAVLGCATLPIYLNGNPITGDVDTSYLTVRVDDLTSAPTVTVPTGLETAFTSALFSFASMGDGLDKIKAILDLALKGATFGAKLPLIGEELEAGAEIIQKINDFVKNPLGSLGVVNPDVRVDWVDDNVRTPLASALTGAGLLRDSEYARTSDFGPDEGPADTTPGPTDIRLVMLCDGDKHVCSRDDPATTAANGDFDNDGIPNDTDPDDDNDLELDEDDADDDNDGIPDTEDDDTGNTNESEMITDLKEVTLEFEIGQGSRNPTDGDCAPGAPSDDVSLQCPADGVDVPIDFALPGLNLQANQPAKAKAGWNLQLGFGVNTEDGFFLLDNPRPAFGAADDGTSDAGEELKVGFGVKLAQAPGTDPELSGRIGFLDIEMEDLAGSDTNESHLNAGFDSNLTGSGSPVCEADTNPTIPQANCSRRITLAQLDGFNVADNLQPVVAADLDVDLQIKTGIDFSAFEDDTESESITAKLPKVQGDFSFEWAWTSAEPGSFGAPTISFTNVGINAGPFFSDVLQPIFTGVRRFTDPLKPIREFIFAPIPVLSDVSRLFGGGDITYVDLAEIFGDVDLSLLEDVDDLLTFIDSIGALSDSGNTVIPIGDGFNIDGARAIGPAATPDQAKSLIQNANDELNNTGSILGATKGTIDDADKKQELDDLSSGNDISIPILEKPGCVFNMLVGGDCELFLYSPDPFEIEFDYEQPFGPFFGVLYVTIGGFAGARGTISAGYDTKGFRELIQKISSGTGATAGDAVEGALEGIFLGDLDPDTGEDIAEFEVFAGITAGAKLSVVIAEAGVRGGVEATVGLNLHDGPEIDGKLRISEIRNKIAIPFCLFDVEGRLEAFLEVYLTLGVCPFCAEFDYELARVVLLDFSEGFCPDVIPDLASSSGGVITLNVGDDAGLRGTGWGNADVGPDENFVIRQVDSDTFSITAFGYTEEENGSSFKIRDAADGKDTFLFQGLKAGGSPKGGTSSPAGQVNFTVPVVANLGGDNDSITTGTASDQVEGGPGNDSINVGDGNDGVKDDLTTNDVSGGTGNDTISAGRGGDVVRGGGDADTIDGGVGADHLFGDAGVDRIIGGNNFIQVPGQSTTGDELDVGDKIVGGADGDIIDGGDGGDEIYGDEEDSGLGDATANGDGATGLASGGNDKITGGLGSDDIYAGNGADEATGAADATTVDNSSDDVFGNGGSDKLHGSLGGDNLYGGPGNDQAFGEGGDDNLFGQGGSDRLEGDVGADDLDGGPGDDERAASGTAPDGTPFKAGLSGGAGNDDIIGGSGEDDLFGVDGEDFLMGDLGTIDDTNPAARVAAPQQAVGDADRLFGGTESDDLFGEGGTDEMHGDVGEDYMEGNGDIDNMFGDNDNDLMLGNDGNDVMQGGPDTDRMFGNDGDDTMLGQTGADKMIGGSEATSSEVGPSDTGDHMFGGTENDIMIGDNGNITSPPVLGLTGGVGTFGNDIMNGGPGDDLMHGQEGDDLMYGAENYDQMFGDLGDDDMFGESGHDYMLGDQGTIAPTPGASPSTYPSNDPGPGAVKNDVSLDDPADTEDPNDGGIDEMDGGTGDDHMYGGAANDIMEGGWDDDVMEGNGGRDSMYGASSTADDGVAQDTDVNDALFDGQDDMIGGSSDVNPETVDFDEGEIEMFGNAAQDVMTGDNANITRLTNGAGTLWAIDIVTGGVGRDVELLDTEKTGTALAEVSGNDYIQGNDQNDRIYGEAGNDCTKGNADEDYLEGNQDTDWVEGNDAQDDLIGGSAVDDQPDAGDYLHGGAAADVITGDNALVTREVGVVPVLGDSPIVTSPPDDYAFHTNRLEIPMQRTVQLLDLAAFAADAAGPDQVSGGSGSDVLFGQDENDLVSGGSENDYMEGNGHTDRLYGDDLLDAVPQAELDALEIPTACPSGALQLSGAQGVAGQDDQLGGSSIKNHRDDNDFIYGNGAQDFQLGDNGFLFRTVDDVSATTDAGYLHYLDANPDTIQRRAVRFDVGTPNTDVFGDDEMYGQDGDDYQYGQDGDDLQLGGNQNDDMFGELGDDRMFGENGEDAMLGDRGTITDDLIVAATQSNCAAISTPECDPASFTIATKGPPFITFTAFRPGTLDRRFDLRNDGDGDVDNDGNPVESAGHDVGGQDFMRGGPDHDSMHGADGDDVMNGDSFGDIVYGDDGADALWGGKGSDDQANLSSRGTHADCAAGPGGNCTDDYLDYVFGGHGGDPNQNQGVVTGGADVIDFRPRPDGDPTTPGDQPDPAAWFEITDTADADDSDNQHHEGIDWIYGGWDRDVMQSNVSANGPNDGDRLIDWDGAYNLYTHCNPAYGGYNDLRALSPTMIGFLERFAFATGVGTSVANVQSPTSSAYREVAIVYQKDIKFNSGKAYPTTPGHFDSFSCAP